MFLKKYFAKNSRNNKDAIEHIANLTTLERIQVYITNIDA